MMRVHGDASQGESSCLAKHNSVHLTMKAT